MVSWNTRELLRECLLSLQPDAAAGLAEVWVFDNDSTDGSAALVRAEFPWVGLIASDENLGYGVAANRIAEQTSTAWIAVANADVRLQPGALETLLNIGEDQPAAGIIAPRLLHPDGTTQHSVYSFPTLPRTITFNFFLTRASTRLAERMALPGRWNPTVPQSVDWALGAFLFVRRAAWDQLEGFERQQWMFAEDLDLAWRAHAAGWKVCYEPAATVVHDGAASTAQRWGDTADAHWQRSSYAWMLRRRGLFFTRTYAFINTLGAAIRVLLFAPAALILNGDWTRRWRANQRWMKLHFENLVAERRVLEAHR